MGVANAEKCQRYIRGLKRLLCVCVVFGAKGLGFVEGCERICAYSSVYLKANHHCLVFDRARKVVGVSSRGRYVYERLWNMGGNCFGLMVVACLQGAFISILSR